MSLTNNLYDYRFLDNTVALLEQELNDLRIWSVYNDDLCLEEVEELFNKFAELKIQFFKAIQQREEVNQ